MLGAVRAFGRLSRNAEAARKADDEQEQPARTKPAPHLQHAPSTPEIAHTCTLPRPLLRSKPAVSCIHTFAALSPAQRFSDITPARPKNPLVSEKSWSDLA